MKALIRASFVTAIGLVAAAACGGASSNASAPAPAPEPDGGGSVPLADSGSSVDGATQPDAGPTCSPDVKVDPKNCGSCGHDCLGSPCLEGRCVPVIVAGSLESPDAVQLDATHIYWQSAKNGHVWRVAKTGGAPELLTPAQPDFQLGPRPRTYVDATHVYFTNNDQQAIRRVPKTGAPGGAPSELVDSLLNMVPTFAADADNIYMVSGIPYGIQTLYRGPKSSPGATTEMGGVFAVVSLAADDTTLFWAELDDSLSANTGSVRSIAKTTTLDAGTSTVLADNQGNPGALTTDATYLYWANVDTGTVKKAPKAGGAAVTVASAQFKPASLAVDATNIYWVALGNGDIVSCPLSGCGVTARALAVGQVSPTSLAVDDKAVYWTSATGGTVMKVAK